MRATDYIYDAVKKECVQLDAIYEDYILELVGIAGLRTLKKEGLLEPCGVVNGRQLYVLTKE